MTKIIYNEKKNRGSFSFPAEYHYVTSYHPRFTMPYHWHVEYELLHVIKGNLILNIDENDYPLKDGDIVFINDGSIHGVKLIDKDTVYECIVFDKRLFTDTIQDKELLHDFIYHRIIISLIFNKHNFPAYREAVKLFSAMRNKSIGYEYISQGILLILLGTVLEHKIYSRSVHKYRSSSRKNVIKLKKTFDLIQKQYQQPLTLKAMADASGFSSKYFCRFFKSITNKSPIEYLNYFRIEVATIKLISNNNLSITDIAFACGFNDLSYFIKTFKKYKGCTPNRYIKNHNKIVNGIKTN